MNICRKQVQENRDTLFIFGDNALRRGLGGQAKEVRGEINSFGIATKWKPTFDTDAFFTDDDADALALLSHDLTELEVEILQYKKVLVFPGIGTGLSRMNTRAPKLFAFLTERLSLILKNATDRHIQVMNVVV